MLRRTYVALAIILLTAASAAADTCSDLAANPSLAALRNTTMTSAATVSGTFTPPDATVDTHVRANEIAATERAVWTDTLFGETTVHVHRFETDVLPQGPAPMQLLPDTTAGNFFNEQHRETMTYQVIATLSGSKSTKRGTHLFKGGVDLLRKVT